MSTRALRLQLAAVLVAASAWGADDPFVGHWKLNSSRSTFIDQLKIEAKGPNTYAITFAGSREAETIVADGTDQPGQGGTTFSIAVERPGIFRVVRKMQGRTVITGVWTLSENGETFSDAMTMTQTDGSTLSAHMLYKRAAAGSGFAGSWEGTNAELPAFECRIEPYEGDGLTFSYPGQQRTQHMKFDGKDYPTVGPNVPEGSTSSGRRVNERTIRMSGKSKGTVTSNQELTVSPDLKTLTITVRPVGQAKPNVFVFDRQ